MQQANQTIQYGLNKLRNGAQLALPQDPKSSAKKGGKKERVILITVGDKTRHPHAKFVARCMTCRKDWGNPTEMVADHPPLKEMIESEEIHSWCFHSDEPSESPEPIPEGASKEERKAIEARNMAIPKIGYVSDDDWI